MKLNLEPGMDNNRLLQEIDLLLRNFPQLSSLRNHELDAVIWTGQLYAVLDNWKIGQSTIARAHLALGSYSEPPPGSKQFSEILAMLHHAKYDLILKNPTTQSSQFDKGSTLDYFDEIRKIVETARTELFFVDAYLDANFGSRYFPFVPSDVSVRLLGKDSDSIKKLVPSAAIFKKSRSASVEVKESSDIHDRFVFVDRKFGHMSGSSFKDGARKAPVMLTQIVDTFEVTFQTYEKLWSNAKSLSLI